MRRKQTVDPALTWRLASLKAPECWGFWCRMAGLPDLATVAGLLRLPERATFALGLFVAAPDLADPTPGWLPVLATHLRCRPERLLGLWQVSRTPLN
jgi:hypothetical protein